jgi:leader peptidase (prepilin peptidase)/N-methyltransferase
MDASDSMADVLSVLVQSPFGVTFAAIWGGLWGSFFNVCIHRVGVHESVVRPRSRCPRCGRGVRALENVPVLSWLALRGRCAGCGLPISIRYPLVELLSAGLATALWLHLRDQASVDPVHVLAHFFVGFALVGTLIVLSGIDLDHLLIPDVITYPAIPIFWFAALLLGDVPRLELVLGPIVGYGLVAVTAEVGALILKREAMGYGDAKLLALIGAALGWRAVVFTFFAAPFVGLLVLLPLALVRRQRLRGVELPYGPFLAVAAIVYLFVSDQLAPLWPRF